MLSNPTTTMDSVNSYKHYVDKAVELNMKAIGITEHGNVFEWLHKKEYAERNGLKYIHGVEAYVTKDITDKIRDNYHVILLAKNYDGFKEINYLLSDKVAFNREDNHFYYQPRITFDELINTSDNIIITTACLAGILGGNDKDLIDDYIKFLIKNKHRCYLEIQHHNVKTQREYNNYLYSLNKRYGIPLITGTDTHSLNDKYSEGRLVLQKSKNTFFDNEKDWDLTFKSYDELIDSYKIQNSLPLDVVVEAIENTNYLADLIEEFEVDRNKKYPVLYENSKQVFKDKIKDYIKERNIKLTKKHKERIAYELETYKHNEAIDYMLLEEDIKSWCRKNGIEYGYGRGSVTGSYIAYLLKITDIDSIKHNASFERFMNSERVSIADIDTDYPPSKRHLVKEYIYNKKGLYCADIITFNTIADKGAIRDVGRALDIPLNEVDSITKRLDTEEVQLREEYPELFKYVDLLKGVVTSVSFHPCGVLVSPFPIEDIVGTFTTATNDKPITQLNMKELDSLNFVKLDILGLDNIEIINETCKLANIERLNPDNVDVNDVNVWKSILNSSLGIFQWESDTAYAYYRRLFGTKTINSLKNNNPNFDYMELFSMGNGAIRPAGESYREALANGEFKDNGHEVLNEFLAPTNGYLVYQETIIEFLNKFCGFTMGEADVVRRGFAKKTGTEQFIPKIKDGFIKTMKEKYNVDNDRAEELIVDFIKVIEDASSYLFSYNHSLSYSYIGYICAYLRYYYPLEFLTVMLNVNKDNLEKTALIMDYINDFTDIKIMPIKFGKSKAEYNFDKDKNVIYKGVGSIKYCSSKAANELFDLSQKYKSLSFVELLRRIKDETSTDSRMLKILTVLNYFSDYGKNRKLLEIIDMYEKLAHRKQINFDNIDKFKINEDILQKYSNKKTDKLYKELDILGYINEVAKIIEDRSLPIKKQIKAELEYLEYISYTNPNLPNNFYYVINLKTYKDKAKPYLTLYRLKDGKYIKTKIINRQKFIKNPFKKDDVIRVIDFKDKNKYKLINGSWERTNEMEKVLNEWECY